MTDDKALRRLLRGPSPLGKAAIKLQQFRVSPSRYVIPGLPYCDDPVPINREEARPSAGYVGLSLQMHGPCRKCAKCLLFRAMKWAERMMEELHRAPRSWHAVLTFDPVHLAGVHMESRRFPHLAPGDAIERAAYTRHVDLYLKRLRKSGARFRYCGVPEFGEEHGRLHYHLLLHESSEGCLTKRMIDRQWRSFTHARLVSPSQADRERSARYVSKYLTKQRFRIRASLGYGKPEL